MRRARALQVTSASRGLWAPSACGEQAPIAGTMERALELVDERHGGSAAWLLAHGLDDLDLQRLRRRLPLGAVDEPEPR